MNQSDFRALLSASSSSGGAGNGPSGSRSGGFGGKRQLTEADLAEVQRLSKPKKPKKKGGRKPSSSSGDAGGDTGAAAAGAAASSAYRDRAAERRQGGAADMVDAAEFAHLDAAQSKFLGGDLAHTHLVKGLDFALLSQLKREREALLQATAAAQQQKQKQLASGAKQQQQQVAFKTRLGRLVYFHAVQSSAAAAPPTEHFLPGRMYYTFNVSASAPASAPVVVQRSKEDCPEPDEVVSGMVSQLVISRVGDVLRAKRHGGKKLRRKKKPGEDGVDGAAAGASGGAAAAAAALGSDNDGDDEHVAAESTHAAGAGDGDAVATNPAAQDDSEDDDIFPDAGEYVPVHARAEADEEHEATRPSGSAGSRSEPTAGYFRDLSASSSAAERAEKQREADAEQAWKQTIRKVAATQSAAEREQKAREQQAKELRAGATVDEYSECYPAYQAAASALDSEDDEEKPRRSKDEEPEASAEDAAAEKSRRRKQKQGNKLQNDLEKISKILDEKAKKPQ